MKIHQALKHTTRRDYETTPCSSQPRTHPPPRPQPHALRTGVLVTGITQRSAPRLAPTSFPSSLQPCYRVHSRPPAGPCWSRSIHSEPTQPTEDQTSHRKPLAYHSESFRPPSLPHPPPSFLAGSRYELRCHRHASAACGMIRVRVLGGAVGFACCGSQFGAPRFGPLGHRSLQDTPSPVLPWTGVVE